MTGISRARVVGWLSFSAADAAGRLAIQLGSTIILARLLAPEDFGRTMLVLVAVQTLILLVQAGFEEALVQREEVTPEHLATAFWTVTALGAALAALCWAAAGVFAATFDDPRLPPLLRGAALLLPLNGPAVVILALLRRRMAFRAMAAGNLLGQGIGAGTAVAMAVAGLGAWSLIGQRLVAAAVTTLVLAVRAAWVPPLRWSRRRLAEMQRFILPHLADRAVEAGTETGFAMAVSALFGPAGLGYLNIAMRLTEPIRSVIGVAGHYVGMSIFARLQSDPASLREALLTAVTTAAMLAFPAFAGLGLCAPALIALMAGPGWETSIPLAQCLAAAALIAVPCGLLHTAFTAIGRPEYSLASSLIELAAATAGLLTLTGLGILAAGVTRAGMSAGAAVFDLTLACRRFGIVPGTLARRIAPGAAATTLMAGCVLLTQAVLPPQLSPAAVLAISVSVGIATYGVTVAALAPAAVRQALGAVGSRRRGAAGSTG